MTETSQMMLVNRKVRRFIRRMSKGQMNLVGINEGPVLLVMQLVALMNRPLKTFKKRIEFAKLLNVKEEPKDEEI